MQAVIGLKMQQKHDGRAYNNGGYILNGADRLISPAEWEKKVHPGCTVELKLAPTEIFELPESTEQITGHRSHHRRSRPVFHDGKSTSPSDQPFSFGPMPLPRTETSRQNGNPGISSDGKSISDTDSQTSQESQEPVNAYETETSPVGHDVTARDMQPGPSSPTHLALWPHSPLDSKTSIHIATGKQNRGEPRPSRRSTGTQSFVEDLEGDTVVNNMRIDKSISVDLADPLPPVVRTSDSSRDLISTTSSGSIESIKQVLSSQPASPEEPTADVQPDTGVEQTPMRPIFAWKVVSSDDPQPAHIYPGESVCEDQDADKSIRAILEEREAEATLYLLEHKREKEILESLEECSRGEVLSKIKAIGPPLNCSATERSAWKRTTRKKQTVVYTAMEILDAFVPVQYHNLHQCWLIKKFYGALLAMTSNSVSRSFSFGDAKETNCLISSATTTSTELVATCPHLSNKSGNSMLGFHVGLTSNRRPSTFPGPWSIPSTT